MGNPSIDLKDSSLPSAAANKSRDGLMDNCAGRFVHKLFRKKRIDLGKLCDTKLARCLNLFDLTALGIGSTLGAGIYVVAGSVAKQVAGPAVIFSFLIAAIASVFAGLCYAEFGARVPKTGSAYVYSYVTVGEIWAFIIGWNLVLEYMIGAASVARAWSATLDAMLYKKISEYLISVLPLNVPQLSEYPDFLAFAITVFSTLILIIGVKSSSRFNNIFTSLNIVVVLFVIVSGIIKGRIENWRIDPDKIISGLNSTDPIAASHIRREELGAGGFFPFGFSGVLSGAATCFYAFIGFDAIATTGEEVKNPQRTLPIAIILSLLCCFLAYVGISAALTLMMPFYQLDQNAPIPFAFSYIGWNKLKIVVALGSMCGLSTSLMGSMFPLPRVIYAMSSDGLLFRFLAKVNPRLKTPVFATIFAGVFAGIMAMLFDLKELVDMMSIGTLLAYTLVAVCVLLLRYRPDEASVGILATPGPLMPIDEVMLAKADLKAADEDDDVNNLQSGSGRSLWRKLFFPKGKASYSSANIVNYLTTLMCIAIACFCLILVKAESSVFDLNPGSVVPLAICGAVAIISFVLIFMQPQNTIKLNFKVPWVPVLPALSVFINLYLMMKLGVNTWIRFSVWMLIGFLIYFLYGLQHSSERDITSEFLEDTDEKSDRKLSFKSPSNNNNEKKRYKNKIKKLNINTARLDMERNEAEEEDRFYENLDSTVGKTFGSKSDLPSVPRVGTQLTFVPSELDINKSMRSNL